MTKLSWLTPQDIYRHYMDDAVTKDGTPVLDIIENCREQLDFEVSVFEMTGCKDSDRPEFDRITKPLRETLVEAVDGVHKLMLSHAETGHWIAFGRRHPDAKEEIIPARYWPFLTLDVKNCIAEGDDMTFRAVRGLITRQIPEGHPVLDRIREAQRLPGQAPAPSDEQAPQPIPELPATGSPGRPSSMHLIRPEFERRAEAGTLESSLARESEALVAWLKAAHPHMPPPTPKTVANNLREDYRETKQPK